VNNYYSGQMKNGKALGFGIRVDKSNGIVRIGYWKENTFRRPFK